MKDVAHGTKENDMSNEEKQMFEKLINYMGITVIIDGRALVLMAIDYVNECFVACEKNRNFKTLVTFDEVGAR